MRAAEQARKMGLHVCPCGTKAIRFANGCWTCQRCLDLDAMIYGTSEIRGVVGFRFRDTGEERKTRLALKKHKPKPLTAR